MARHPGEGTRLWGQPYGSPLDSWVAMPFVVAWGTTTEALRLPSFLLGLLLLPIPSRPGRGRPARSVPPRLPSALPSPAGGAASSPLRDDARAVRNAAAPGAAPRGGA